MIKTIDRSLQSWMQRLTIGIGSFKRSNGDWHFHQRHSLSDAECGSCVCIWIIVWQHVASTVSAISAIQMDDYETFDNCSHTPAYADRMVNCHRCSIAPKHLLSDTLLPGRQMVHCCPENNRMLIVDLDYLVVMGTDSLEVFQDEYQFLLLAKGL